MFIGLNLLSTPSSSLSINCMTSPLRALLILYLVLVVASQSCDNFGIPKGSDCSCYPGFGGPTCAEPACGGNIFQGAQRPLTSSSAAGNLTAGSCSCESGWGGLGCNVCQSASACQNAFRNSNSGPPPLIPGAAENETLTCNTSPLVYAAGQMTCNVMVRGPFLHLLSSV